VPRAGAGGHGRRDPVGLRPRGQSDAGVGSCVTSAVETHDVIVVGAGPAGIRAAVEARAAGAEVLLLDEAPRPGGPVYRQLPPELRPEPRDPLCSAKVKSRPLFADLERAGATVRSGAEVWGVLPERVLFVNHAGRAAVLQAGALILATGAYDRPAAGPGWALPGVGTARGGAARAAAQRRPPRRRALLRRTRP